MVLYRKVATLGFQTMSFNQTQATLFKHVHLPLTTTRCINLFLRLYVEYRPFIYRLYVDYRLCSYRSLKSVKMHFILKSLGSVSDTLCCLS